MYADDGGVDNVNNNNNDDNYDVGDDEGDEDEGDDDDNDNEDGDDQILMGQKHTRKHINYDDVDNEEEVLPLRSKL